MADPPVAREITAPLVRRRRAGKAAIVLVTYSGESAPDEIMRQVEAALAEARLEMIEVQLGELAPEPVARLVEIRDRQDVDIFSIDCDRVQLRYGTLVSALNIHRNTYAREELCAIFWMPKQGMQTFARLASNFLDFRTRLVELAGEARSGPTGDRGVDAQDVGWLPGGHCLTPVSAWQHPLPFDRLSTADFERLCLWLVEREGYERIEALGEAGRDEGRDFVAWKDDRRVAFQCKRVRRFGPKSALAEIEKIRRLSLKEQPDELVFIVTSAVSAKTRKAATTAWGDEETCRFWAGHKLDHKVKRRPEIVEELFQLLEAGARFVVRQHGTAIAGDGYNGQTTSGDQTTANGGGVPAGPSQQSERPVPQPRYPDQESRELSGRLVELYRRREELTVAGEDTRLVEGEIFDLRRLLRKGPQLRAGEFLCDGRYQLIEPLGRGGFATVWKAWESEAERIVALKILHGQYGEDRSRRERFFRGARKMAELAHPHIVRVYERAFKDDGWFFFAMEYISGGNFEQAVLARRLKLEERLRIVFETGTALAHAHRAGVVHRGVKPSDVLLDSEGRAKLTDFDLVRAEDTTGLTATLAMMGTVQFAAPEELLSTQDVGPTADIYSLGSTAVFAVRGKSLPPWYYRSPSQAIAKLECGEPLKRVLIRATEFEPAARQSSVEEFCRELEEASIEAAKPIPRPPPKVLKASPDRRGVRSFSDRKIHWRRGAGRWRKEHDSSGHPQEEIFKWIETPHDGRVELWQEILAGEFWMGSLAGDAHPDERPRHQVTITAAFRLGAVPVTNAQFVAFDPRFKPHSWRDVSEEEVAEHPAVNVSWNQAMDFCSWLAECFRWARGARLPSEEEWEYACRAGTPTRYWGGDQETSLGRVCWFEGNSGWRTHRVGEKPANPWGLYDMHGNVGEWVSSPWTGDYSGHESGRIVDPFAGLSEDGATPRGVGRVIRGGGYGENAARSRAAYRKERSPGFQSRNVGFRVLLPGSGSN